MADIKLQAMNRSAQGKNQVDKLRVEGYVPGVVYEKDKETISIQVLQRAFDKVYNEAGTSTLVDLEFEDGVRTVLIQDIQKHPYRDDILHVDFKEVRMDEKLKVTVPVVLLNRDAIYVQPSVLAQMLDEVEVECLPGDIPQTAEVDVKEMQYGDVLTVGDLDIASNDKLTILAELEEPVATLSEPQEAPEEEETEEEMDAADVPEIGKEEETEEEDAE